MFVRYGSYTHADDEVAVVISRAPLRTEGGSLRGYRETWQLQGLLQAASQSALTTAITALKAAYASDGFDLGLYLAGGTATAHVLRSADCYGGVRVVEQPGWPEGRGAEYSTFRTYSIRLEGDVLNAAVPMLAFTESVNFTGGGPRYVHLQPLNGLPQKQLVAQSTPYRATQSGTATGQFSYPTPPAPLWPAALQPDQTRISYETPKRAGPVGAPDFAEFTVRWEYHFEDAGPLLGRPNRWPV